ncbi:acyl-CoA dehydrogenase family protein [Planotetraspora kaengkrachanensis]|uniref:Acyl-CoA dehydrogenase n=1 Tax=Planotetraspora kaengkrachanensis TaxID=575193 RepID=A0A8J3LWN3_9ACTN|nr:acyl-CoA dehydrogenase family protein [Planotetraspora kaengkrachanensis]GIG77863.1 acyl-CoA dehydrogenase [Planotetraspora kaengkrachanensis]
MITTDEQEELRRTVRALLERNPPARPAPDAEPGYDKTAWRLLAEQVGAFGLAVPEAYGGAGCTAVETHVVCEELGRALTPVPYLGSAVLATEALLACGATDPLPGLADGSRVGSLAWAENGTWDPAAIRAHVEDGRLTGVKDHVLDGAHADLFVVPARTREGGLGVYLAEASSPAVRIEPLVTLDRTRLQARVTFDTAPVRLICADGHRVLERLIAVAATALSAEQLGGGERCLEMTLAHVKTREQFGRPIGSFQAVRHRLADLYVLVESARSVSYDAAHALAAHAPDLAVRAATAQAYCAEAFSAVAAETIQLHGGIGFTWEHEAHLYFKRAHSAAELFGDAAWHRSRLGPVVLGR